MSITTLYHPTVLILDSDRKFLNRLAEKMDHRFSVVLKQNPIQAFEYLSQNKNKMHPYVSPKNLKKIVVTIIVKNLVEMDSLEFCRLAKEKFNLPTQFILLTDTNGLTEAIQAYNEGIIQAYVENEIRSDTVQQINQYLYTFWIGQLEKLNASAENLTPTQLNVKNSIQPCHSILGFR